MTYQTSDFFFKNLAAQGQAVMNTLKNKGQQALAPKTKQSVVDAFNQKNVAAIGNQKLNNSPFSLTRDQRSANVKYGTAPDGRQEALASQSVGRGLSKQQAPRNGQTPIAANQFLDAGGVTRQKMSVGNWKSQQQFQSGQYGGFSGGSFTHFAYFAGGVDGEINKEYQRHQRILDSNPSPQEKAFAERLLQHNLQVIKSNPKSRFLSVKESEKPYN